MMRGPSFAFMTSLSHASAILVCKEPTIMSMSKHALKHQHFPRDVFDGFVEALRSDT
jgi:hypothetical protein